MMRRSRSFWGLVLGAALACTGCQPRQPFYFFDDGDLSHYKGMATEIDYPDVDAPRLAEVEGACLRSSWPAPSRSSGGT